MSTITPMQDIVPWRLFMLFCLRMPSVNCGATLIQKPVKLKIVGGLVL